jgi:hypothetical protein
VENALQPIIMAQKVRIYPYSQYDRTVCLRAELIGCIWDGEFCFRLFFHLVVLALDNKRDKIKKKPQKKSMLIPLICAHTREIVKEKLFHVFV